MKAKTKNYCGCCGREIKPQIANGSTAWCVPCQAHLGPPNLPSYERAYYGMHYPEHCPFQDIDARIDTIADAIGTFENED